jgi:quercetin dioxygenase-like cupin family protein
MGDQAVKEAKAQRSWDRPRARASRSGWTRAWRARPQVRLNAPAPGDDRSTGARRCATSAPAAPASRRTRTLFRGPSFSLILPAGAEGPLHVHNDVEEIFFVLRGKVKLIAEKDGERWEAIVAERDLISWPPGVYRGEINIGEEDALMCVMLGSAKPVTPTYPPDHPLTKIKRG